MKKSILSGLIMALMLSATACSAGSASNSQVAVSETMAYDASSQKYDMGTGVMAETDSPSGSSLSSEGTSQVILPENRKLIRTVSLHLETDDFDSVLEGITQEVSATEGYVESSDVSGSRLTSSGVPAMRSAYLTVRIPSDSLDSFLAWTEEREHINIVNRSENVSDVTLQYTDIESRKKSLEMEQERLWELLEQADSIESIIALEQRLSEVRYNLESLESQLRLYDNQVDYSTVTLSIDEVKSYTPATPPSAWRQIGTGFSRNLKRLGEGLSAFLITLISASPLWVPAVLVLCLIVWGMKKLNRKKGQKGDEQRLPKQKKIVKKTNQPSKLSEGAENSKESDSKE